MTARQKWLLERLLIPAGILPPAISFDDLKYNEQLRKKIGNLGFEYFYILEQDAEKINHSPIGGKISAVHCPWQGFPLIERMSEPFKSIANHLVMKGKNLPRNFAPMIEKTLIFAKNVGAKVVVTHTLHFNHENISQELATLSSLQDKFKIPVAIEHEANYLDLYQSWGHKYRKVDGSFDWMTQPAKLSQALKKFYPRKTFGLCIDTAALINFNLPLVESIRPVVGQTIHVHVANNPPGGDDLALEIDNPEIASFVRFLYEQKYSGYITTEVSATNGNRLEELASKIYGVTSIVGLPLLKNLCIRNAQAHIENSARFLLNHI